MGFIVDEMEIPRAQAEICLCFGLVWFGLVWFGLVWFGLVLSLAFHGNAASLGDKTKEICSSGN